VPIDLPEAQTEILRRELLGWIDGIALDLAHPEPLEDPEASVREAEAFHGLLTALDRSKVLDADATEASGEDAGVWRAGRGLLPGLAPVAIQVVDEYVVECT
jgi:hypothetical protein